ncbi:hypothetical protein EYF80_057269 [Liparis tanakae]|uniref:Uncharacterized protein n=1 Tax=Liparis tanakae TaxID=230148 RepID=A0A4Z2EVK4_9TELE|nr:hypothetical protein EYF80_057269 [Liparis tanakae]
MGYNKREKVKLVVEFFQRPQQQFLPRPEGRHVAVLLQQDAVERALVVDVAPRHQDVLAAAAQVGAVAHVLHPQELAVLQAEAVARVSSPWYSFPRTRPRNTGEEEEEVSSGGRVQLETREATTLTKVLLAVLSLAFPPTFDPPTLPTMPCRGQKPQIRWRMRKEVPVVLLPLQTGQDGQVGALVGALMGVLVGGALMGAQVERLAGRLHRP